MRKPHDNTYILSELHRYLINKGLSNQYVIEQVVILADITNTEIEDILDKII